MAVDVLVVDFAVPVLSKISFARALEKPKRHEVLVIFQNTVLHFYLTYPVVCKGVILGISPNNG